MVLFLAFSLQDQVEKYGAYVGIAAFFGLAVLTVLYFSQAREVRRLRDWAGRAPERAQELEARVTASAQVARTVQAVPRAATPAGATAAAAAGSGTVAPAAPEGAPVEGPQTEAEAAAAGTATQVAEPAEGEKPAEGGGDDGEEPKAEPAAEGEAEAAEKPAAEEGEAEKPAAEPAEPVAASQGGNGAAASEEEQQAPEEAPAGKTNGGPAQPAEVPPIPRATPVPRRTPAPAPAAPLRQPTRSATLPPRRPAPAARRAPAAPAGEGRRNWIVPAILGVVILGAVAFGATQLLGGDDTASPPAADQPAASPSADTGSAAEPSQGGGLTRETVRIAVLNGTTIPGLAATEGDKLKAAGFTREITTGNNTDQQRSESSVLYAEGARAMAREVARRLDIAIVEQIDPDTRSLGEDADVVVILGQDKAP